MKPFLATNAMIEYEHGEPCLAYWAIGDEHGHLLEGTIIRELPNGTIFNARHINETLTLTEFTMQEFEQRCRPDMERMTPGITRDLTTIADVYAFCRRTAPTIHQPEQEEQPMKLTKADIDKVRHIVRLSHCPAMRILLPFRARRIIPPARIPSLRISFGSMVHLTMRRRTITIGSRLLQM